MDPRDRRCIQRNLARLIDQFDLVTIVPFLLSKNVFTSEMMENIMSKPTALEQKVKLLTELQCRGPDAFRDFVDILDSTGFSTAARILNPQRQAPVQIGNGAAEVFHNEAQGRTVVEQEGIGQLKVFPAADFRTGPEIYRMRSEPRGLCMIINNMKFDGIMEYREGSDKDALRLDMVFHGLGYDVFFRSNLEAADMEEQIVLFSQRPEHHAGDSMVLIILSHGDGMHIYGKDEEKVEVEHILKPFNNENCRALVGKPKLFFIQACRGENYDYGTSGKESADSKSFSCPLPSSDAAEKLVPRVPCWSDMAICYSTVLGYVSVRNHKYGSWFCQAIVTVFMKYARDTDFSRLMNKVDNMVKEKTALGGIKQATEVVYRGWGKQLFFNPGLYE